MKLSNIILGSFCALFVIYVFGVAAEIRFRGEKFAGYSGTSVQEYLDDCKSDYSLSQEFPAFKVLKINKVSGVARIKFDPKAQNQFLIYAERQEQLPEMEYHVSGDTLFIDKLDKEGLCDQFTIELTETPQQIIADSMKINLINSSAGLARLNLKGSNATFQLLTVNNSIGSIDSLTVNLDNNSSIHSQSMVLIDHLEGRAWNNSQILLGNSKTKSAQVEIYGQSQFMINDKFLGSADASEKIIYQKSKQ